VNYSSNHLRAAVQCPNYGGVRTAEVPAASRHGRQGCGRGGTSRRTRRGRPAPRAAAPAPPVPPPCWLRERREEGALPPRPYCPWDTFGTASLLGPSRGAVRRRRDGGACVCVGSRCVPMAEGTPPPFYRRGRGRRRKKDAATPSSPAIFITSRCTNHDALCASGTWVLSVLSSPHLLLSYYCLLFSV
jgi:hypothetical protein